MKFTVKVISSNKEKKEIEVDAKDRTTAISNLRSQGFLILEMEEKPSISKHSLSVTKYDNSWTSEEIARADLPCIPEITNISFVTLDTFLGNGDFTVFGDLKT